MNKLFCGHKNKIVILKYYKTFNNTDIEVYRVYECQNCLRVLNKYLYRKHFEWKSDVEEYKKELENDGYWDYTVAIRDQSFDKIFIDA